jgi:hypothetical protein
MKVFLPDGTNFDDFLKEMEIEDNKKNFRNWLDNYFPSGIAGYRAFYVLIHPWEILRYVGHEVKYAWQRVFRGWDDRATLSIDYYLATIIPQMVRELKKDEKGVPTSMFEDLSDESDESFAIARERWNKILDQIAEGFDAYKKIDDLSWKDQGEAYKNFQETTFEVFKKYFASLWW